MGSPDARRVLREFDNSFLPRTHLYRCNRCLCQLESPPLRRGDMVYALPPGWVLIPLPLDAGDDHLRCVECQGDVARGSPEVIG